MRPGVQPGPSRGLLPTGELLHAGTHKRGSHLCRLRHGHIVREQYGEMRFSVTSPVQNALLRESDTPRVRLYVSHRLQSGALVYTVATLRTAVGTQKCTQIGENGLSMLVWGTCVHCCGAIRRGVNTLTPEGPHSGVIFLVMVHVSHRYREEDLLLGHPQAPSPMP